MVTTTLTDYTFFPMHAHYSRIYSALNCVSVYNTFTGSQLLATYTHFNLPYSIQTLSMKSRITLSWHCSVEYNNYASKSTTPWHRVIFCWAVVVQKEATLIVVIRKPDAINISRKIFIFAISSPEKCSLRSSHHLCTTLCRFTLTNLAILTRTLYFVGKYLQQNNIRSLQNLRIVINFAVPLSCCA